MCQQVYQYNVAIKTVPGVLVRPLLGWGEVESFSASDEEREYLKRLPTSFKLSDDQVDRLIAAGRNILRESPDYQAVLDLLR